MECILMRVVQLTGGDLNLKFAYDALVKTSRSFASVILQLGDELRDSVALQTVLTT